MCIWVKARPLVGDSDHRCGDPRCGGCGYRLRHDGRKTDLMAKDFADNLAPLRSAIEKAVPMAAFYHEENGIKAWGDLPRRFPIHGN